MAKFSIDSLPYHEVVFLFPEMAGEQLAGFEESIKTHGIIVPVEWWSDPDDGVDYIIDGRSRMDRFRKFKAEGVVVNGEPISCPHVEFKGTKVEMLEHVLGVNRDKRQLTTGQRAAVSVKAGHMQLRYNKKRAGKDFAEEVAKRAGTNRSYIFECQRLYTEAKDLLDSVLAGEITVPQAKAKLNARRAAAATPVAEDGGDEPEVQGKGKSAEVAAAPPPPPIVVLDGNKKAVPEEMHAVFIARDAFNVVIRTLRGAKNGVEALKAGPAGVGIHGNEIEADISRAIQHLTQEMPHVVCVACNGTKRVEGTKRKCPTCQGVGFHTKASLKAVAKGASEKEKELEASFAPPGK